MATTTTIKHTHTQSARVSMNSDCCTQKSVCWKRLAKNWTFAQTYCFESSVCLLNGVYLRISQSNVNNNNVAYILSPISKRKHKHTLKNAQSVTCIETAVARLSIRWIEISKLKIATHQGTDTFRIFIIIILNILFAVNVIISSA